MSAIHTKQRRYSVLRAMRSAAKGEEIRGLEGEVSTEVRGRVEGKTWKGQFSMPVDPDPDIRGLMYPNYQRRDLNTTTGAGGIFQVLELPMIDLLRARMVLAQLGCTVLSGMQGTFALTRVSSQSSVSWLDEGSPANTSAPNFDKVPFSPSVAIDLVNVSRQFLNQTSLSAENLAIGDIAQNLAVELDRVAINGQGSSANQPLGFLNNSAIQAGSASLQMGTNGGQPAWANIVDLETNLALSNADGGQSLGYLTTPILRGSLKKTPKIAGSTNPAFIWEDGPEYGSGKMNSYRAFATNNVPSNLTKGTGTALSTLVFANWRDLVLATWGEDGIDFLVNPFTTQAMGSVQISATLSCDVQVRHQESFRVISDAASQAG